MNASQEFRGTLILSLALLAGCGGGEPKPAVLPAELEGGWKLVSSSAIPMEMAPDLARQYRALRIVQGRYQGNGPMLVTWFETSSPAVAFELSQKWRPAPGILFLHHGPWFVLIEAKALDNRALTRIAQAIESSPPLQ